MSGIYVHIPYCKQACYYCDFHFSTNLNTKSELVEAILNEIKLQRDYLESDQISTIYFGGGTPSLLSREELRSIIDCIYQNFTISDNPEITLEANPDDLTEEKLNMLKDARINRLSVGIQSFDDQLLKFFNRAHDSTMARKCIADAKAIGFDNISVDLIFGAPDQRLEDLRSDLDQMIELDVPHVSIYGLTIEKETVFGRWYDQNKLIPLNDDVAAQHLELIMSSLAAAGYTQYEISNFCRPDYESRHNSSYWHGVNYLGIGPGAHTYNGATRQYNISNNIQYINALKQGKLPITLENLTREDQINEIILTQLRLKEGINCAKLKKEFSFDLPDTRSGAIEEFQSMNLIETSTDFLRLTSKGKLLADFITEKLII